MLSKLMVNSLVDGPNRDNGPEGLRNPQKIVTPRNTALLSPLLKTSPEVLPRQFFQT